MTKKSLYFYNIDVILTGQIYQSVVRCDYLIPPCTYR